MFASPRLVRFYEMEYAIPREAVPEALNRVRALVDRLGVPISFPVEVRVVAPDDIPLSTAHGRATGYIAVHVYNAPRQVVRSFDFEDGVAPASLIDATIVAGPQRAGSRFCAENHELQHKEARKRQISLPPGPIVKG